jgi:hypothetical protein
MDRPSALRKFGRWLATGPHYTGSQIRQEWNLPLASIGLSSNYKIIKTKTNLVLTFQLLKIFHNAETDISVNEKGTPYTFRKFNWNITNMPSFDRPLMTNEVIHHNSLKTILDHTPSSLLLKEPLEVDQRHGHDQHNPFYCSEFFLHLTKRTAVTCSEIRHFWKIYSSFRPHDPWSDGIA